MKTAKTSARAQRWTNVATGKSVIVDARVELRPKTKKLLRSAGILVCPATAKAQNEGEEIEALLESMGAVKLTRIESRRYRQILHPSE